MHSGLSRCPSADGIVRKGGLDIADDAGKVLVKPRETMLAGLLAVNDENATAQEQVGRVKRLGSFNVSLRTLSAARYSNSNATDSSSGIDSCRLSIRVGRSVLGDFR